MSTPWVAVCWVSALTALASPKSATLTRPSSAISTFSGFTSRCTMPARWAAASAESTGSSTANARPGAIGASLAMRVAQRVAGDQLHHQEHGAVVVALVEHRDDVRVGEPGRRPGLAHEALGEVAIIVAVASPACITLTATVRSSRMSRAS